MTVQHSIVDGVEGKVCAKCGTWKPLTEYYKQKARLDGLYSYCKPCSSIVNRQWQEAHKDERREYRAMWNAEHVEHVKKRRAERYAVHGDKLREYSRQWYWDHREQRKEYSARDRAEHPEKYTERGKRWRREHREEHLAKLERWRADNADRVLAYRKRYQSEHAAERRAYMAKWEVENADKIRLYGERRKARKLGAAGADYTTAEMVTARWEMYGNRCWICGAPATATDHVKPLAAGGAHLPCNMRPICKHCNSSKGAKWPYPTASYFATNNDEELAA